MLALTVTFFLLLENLLAVVAIVNWEGTGRTDTCWRTEVLALLEVTVMGRISDVALDFIPLRSKCLNKYSCLLSCSSEQAIPGKSLSELVHGRAPCPRSTPSIEGHYSWGLDSGGYMSSRTGDAGDGNMAHAVT